MIIVVGRAGLACLAALAASLLLSLVRSVPAATSLQLVLGAASALALLLAANALRPTIDAAARGVALALGLLAAIDAVLLHQWLRGDDERFLWVMHQPGPCSYSGGKAALYVGALTLTFGLALCGYAVDGGIGRRPLLVAVGIASTLAVVTALVMFPDPTLFTRILGCV